MEWQSQRARRALPVSSALVAAGLANGTKRAADAIRWKTVLALPVIVRALIGQRQLPGRVTLSNQYCLL